MFVAYGGRNCCLQLFGSGLGEYVAALGHKVRARGKRELEPRLLVFLVTVAAEGDAHA
jgi:hypothetical protein